MVFGAPTLRSRMSQSWGNRRKFDELHAHVRQSDDEYLELVTKEEEATRKSVVANLFSRLCARGVYVVLTLFLTQSGVSIQVKSNGLLL